MSGVLPKQEIQRLLSQTPPLLEGMVNADEQVQPNGVDITLRQIAMFSSAGRIGTSNLERRLSDTSPLVFDGLGDMELMAGAYLVTFNEVVNLPPDVMAIGQTRSSLLRCGVSINNAIWDAGYSGRSQALLVVFNPYGFRLKKDARLLQLVFIRLTTATESVYKGMFQGENK
ncbi:MAG: deoxyuridine 5'-triphosphate nucleotidohydrolase [Dehalococcoidia bacterium]|nr:deoxyuridine 5'-triphosphate nucleotidohydrolase [Dehalococcoidia bacterium]